LPFVSVVLPAFLLRSPVFALRVVLVLSFAVDFALGVAFAFLPLVVDFALGVAFALACLFLGRPFGLGVLPNALHCSSGHRHGVVFTASSAFAIAFFDMPAGGAVTGKVSACSVDAASTLDFSLGSSLAAPCVTKLSLLTVRVRGFGVSSDTWLGGELFMAYAHKKKRMYICM